MFLTGDLVLNEAQDQGQTLQGQLDAWQIVAGNAGSEVVPGWNPPGGLYYGFTLAKVYASGRVGIVNYARPVPPVYHQLPAPPATPRPELFLDR